MNPIRRTRKVIRPLVLALAVAGVPAAAVASAQNANATTCAVTWGSLVKQRPGMTAAQITNVRSGRHPCYDRLVVDLNGRGAGYHVSYVTNVFMDGSGALVPLRGGAKLAIVVRAPAYTDAGTPTYTPANARELVNVAGYSTFRQVAWAGSFEGQTTIGLGVRARLPMNAFILNGPGAGSRVVIDVAHRW